MPAPQTPLLTVDVVVRLIDRPDVPVVLIKRRNPPAGWALPGGFVDVGETTETAARREIAEETGLEVVLRGLLGVYSDPARDPRGHTVSAVYVGDALGEPRGDSDATEAASFRMESLPAPLAFDHERILSDYRDFAHGRRPLADLAPGVKSCNI